MPRTTTSPTRPSRSTTSTSSPRSPTLSCCASSPSPRTSPRSRFVLHACLPCSLEVRGETGTEPHPAHPWNSSLLPFERLRLAHGDARVDPAKTAQQTLTDQTLKNLQTLQTLTDQTLQTLQILETPTDPTDPTDLGPNSNLPRTVTLHRCVRSRSRSFSASSSACPSLQPHP